MFQYTEAAIEYVPSIKVQTESILFKPGEAGYWKGEQLLVLAAYFTTINIDALE